MAVLNDKIEGARSVTKTNTTSIETFNSPNGGPIGYVDTAGGIRFMTLLSRPAASAICFTALSAV